MALVAVLQWLPGAVCRMVGISKVVDRLVLEL